jgi:clathrin heavy chain
MLLQKIMAKDPEKGTEFATMLANDESGPLIDIEKASISFITLLLLKKY